MAKTDFTIATEMKTLTYGSKSAHDWNLGRITAKVRSLNGDQFGRKNNNRSAPEMPPVVAA